MKLKTSAQLESAELAAMYEADRDSEADSDNYKDQYYTLVNKIATRYGDTGYGQRVDGSINVIDLDQRKDNLLKAKKTSFDHEPILSRSEIADIYHGGRSENFIKVINLLSSNNNLLTIDRRLLKTVIEPAFIDAVGKGIVKNDEFPLVIDQDGLSIGPTDDIKRIFDKIGLVYKIKSAQMPASFEEVKPPPSITGEFKIAVKSFDKDGNQIVSNTVVPVSLGDILQGRYTASANLADGEEQKVNNRINKFSAKEPDLDSVRAFLGGNDPDFIDSSDNKKQSSEYKRDLTTRQNLINSLIRQLYADLKNYKNIETLKNLKSDDLDVFLGSTRGGDNEDSLVIEQGTMALCETLKHLLYTQLKNLCNCKSPTEMYRYISLKETVIRSSKVKLLNQKVATVGPAQIIQLLPWLYEYLNSHYISNRSVSYVYIAATKDEKGNISGGRSVGRTLQTINSKTKVFFDKASNKKVTVQTIEVAIPNRKAWYELDPVSFEIIKNKKGMPIEFGVEKEEEEEVTAVSKTLYPHIDIWPHLKNINSALIARNILHAIHREREKSGDNKFPSAKVVDEINDVCDKIVTSIVEYLNLIAKKINLKTVDKDTDIGKEYIIAALNCISDARTLEEVRKFEDVGTSLSQFIAIPDSSDKKVQNRVRIENLIKLSIAEKYPNGPIPLHQEELDSLTGNVSGLIKKEPYPKDKADVVVVKKPDQVERVKTEWIRKSPNWPIFNMAYQKYKSRKDRLITEMVSTTTIINQTIEALKNIDVTMIKTNIANLNNRKSTLLSSISPGAPKGDKDKLTKNVAKILSKSKDGYVGFYVHQVEPVALCLEKINKLLSDTKIFISAMPSDIRDRGKFDISRYIGFLDILGSETNVMIKGLKNALYIMENIVEGEPILGDEGQKMYLSSGEILRGERNDYVPKIKSDLKEIGTLLREVVSSANDKALTAKELVSFMTKRPDLIRVYDD